jgi:hypothetical protein
MSNPPTLLRMLRRLRDGGMVPDSQEEISFLADFVRDSTPSLSSTSRIEYACDLMDQLSETGMISGTKTD